MSNKDGFEIEFTPRIFKEFKRAYTVAVEKDQENFTFHTRTIHTGYAKYLIEYLDEKFQDIEEEVDDVPHFQFPKINLN